MTMSFGREAAVFIAGLLRAGCRSGELFGGSWDLRWQRPLLGPGSAHSALSGFRAVSGLRCSAVGWWLCGLEGL